MIDPSCFKTKGSRPSYKRESTKTEEEGIMVGVESAENLNKSFRKGNTPVNSSYASVKFFG
jgi:hypothetical protein